MTELERLTRVIEDMKRVKTRRAERLEMEEADIAAMIAPDRREDFVKPTTTYSFPRPTNVWGQF